VILELEGVRKNYGSGVQALRGLTGTVSGQRIGLLGPNGAGKSTLLKVLLGLLDFSGKARVLGHDPRTQALAIRARVGYMPEGECYLPGMSAVEYCTYAAELSGLPRTPAMQRAHAALDYAGLEDKRYLPVETYSTGMKQKVKLAQAIVHDPELLFLDEPTNGLDPRGREEMLSLILEIPKRRGATLLVSTHILADVERVCESALVLNQGSIAYHGTLDELRGKGDRGLEVRVKSGAAELVAGLAAKGCTVRMDGDAVVVDSLPAGASIDLVLEEARSRGLQVRHLAVRKLTLEAAFLKTVADDAARHATGGLATATAATSATPAAPAPGAAP